MQDALIIGLLTGAVYVITFTPIFKACKAIVDIRDMMQQQLFDTADQETEE